MSVHLIDVDTIVHYGAPSSTDGYFQGRGRGSRSGNSAQSIVFGSQQTALSSKKCSQHVTTKFQMYVDMLIPAVVSGCYTISIQMSHAYRDPKSCCDVCSNTGIRV